MTDTVDPLAGSYFVESLTNEVESAALDYIARIDKLGGAVAAIESGFMQDEIEQAAYEYAKAVESGDEVVVGVNSFAEEDAGEPEVFPLRPVPCKKPDRRGCRRFQGIAGSSAASKLPSTT